MRQEEALRNALKHVLPLMRREAEATEPPNLNLHLEGMTEEEYEEEWGLNAELYAEWMMAIQIVEDALDATADGTDIERLVEWLEETRDRYTALTSEAHKDGYIIAHDYNQRRYMCDIVLDRIREEHGYGEDK